MWAGTPNFYRVCIGEVFCFWTLHRSELCHVWLGYITCEQAHEISAEYAQGGFSIFNFASLKGCFRTADREVEAQMGYICMFIPVYICVVYLYVYTCVYMCTCTYVYKYTWTRSWGADGIHLHIYTCVYVCTYIYVYKIYMTAELRRRWSIFK